MAGVSRCIARFTLASFLLAGVIDVVGGLGATAGAATSGAPITLAMITSLTGPGSSEFTTAPAGFDARIALQNAEGGVNGHKLSGLVLDDQTSPTEVTTAVQDAISKGAFGIVSTSALFFLAAKYPNQQGVPVTGGFFDGPEWGTPPYNTNMFAADVGSLDPKYPVNTAIGSYMKAHGGTVLCSYGYSISPSSTRSAIGTMDSFVHAGGKEGELDTTIPFGSVDMTTAALVAKQKGCNAFYAGLDDNSNFALATALKQAGVKPKIVVFPTGFESSVVGSPAWSDLQGGYFDTTFRPFQLPDAGTEQMAAALQKYEHFKPGEFPNFSQYESWLGADLMIKGLELAGKNPTRAGVITALRNLKSYNGNGLLPESINYSNDFGHDLAKTCGWYMIAEKNGFVPASSQPTCGTDLPGTTTVSG
ncbi:MAG TPA: ABC transporter substrate-binding protein [Acidimicrobiales bacterium]|nr:ABC transporter substrate-binding protein [Acidimicrobiales bacterium]